MSAAGDSPFVKVAVGADRLVRVTRTAARVASAADIDAMTAHTRQALRFVARPQHVLLLDLRQVAIADETNYAAAMRAFRREVLPGFRRAACLVETQVGLLQVQRFLREEGLSALVLDDERRALAALSQP
jgi:hypothetical protein